MTLGQFSTPADMRLLPLRAPLPWVCWELQGRGGGLGSSLMDIVVLG